VDIRLAAGVKRSAADMTGKGIAALTLALACAAGAAQDPESVGDIEKQIRIGAEIYARHCSPCHGSRMQDAQGAFDLRKFPPEQKSRFVTSVTKGKNAMPPWGDVLKPADLDALWTYVLAGEKQ
jgi:mono/diheme cytochrome c family protein